MRFYDVREALHARITTYDKGCHPDVAALCVDPHPAKPSENKDRP